MAETGPTAAGGCLGGRSAEPWAGEGAVWTRVNGGRETVELNNTEDLTKASPGS